MQKGVTQLLTPDTDKQNPVTQEPFKALEKFVKAYNILEDSDCHLSEQADCLLCISMVYYILKDVPNALWSCEKASELQVCDEEA